MSNASRARPRSAPEPRAVEVWHTRLDAHRDRVAALAATLSADERARAARFHRGSDAAAFVLRRGILRELLGGYLRLDPGAVRFTYGRWDKPFVDAGATSSGRPSFHADSSGHLAFNASSPGRLSFNASSSGDVALYAFAVGRAVGVDVERVRPLPDMDAVAGRISSARGAAAYGALPARDRIAAFFATWTQKEAYVKALGDGFAAPLDAFDVPLRPRVGSATVVAGRRIEVLRAPVGYAAAVAADGDGWSVACRAY